MLLLFETACGFSLFKVIKEKKLTKCENVLQEFSSADALEKLVSLKAFDAFKDADEALKVTTSMHDGKLSKKLKKLLARELDEGEQLAVADSKLAALIKEKLNVGCVANSTVQQLMSCIRGQMDSLIPNLAELDNDAMQLALAHGLSRFKVKFSADKVDMMIIHAVSLLDDLDRELNNYIMRCKEWYGWHFPELAKLVPDNEQYIKTILAIGMKENAVNIDLSEILEEKTESLVKEMAEVSMGTEITEEDMSNIEHLCKNVQELYEYRTQLFEYIKNRMMAIAPNLSILVGELVGARLISKAGSLLNLAKHPASTIQILGAEKALFRALKTKHDTPKYGLIYHAQLVGLSNQKIKGKMSRALAAKAALSCRMDALGEDVSNELGLNHKARLESKLKFLEEGGLHKISKSAKKSQQQPKFEFKSKVIKYKDSSDSTMKPKIKQEEEMQEAKSKKRSNEEADVDDVEQEAPDIEEDDEEFVTPAKSFKSEKKSKSKKRKQEEAIDDDDDDEQEAAIGGDEGDYYQADEAAMSTSSKKHKKKKSKKSHTDIDE